ncbi:hypothetical protein B296_00057772 [Ensete ventricosum]|uniref:Uncharacterized protein n=1 Tax=Ensete ventricosum TaxID=4639 RepID=A0A426X1E1_ENSVE|nr:hypothetical protein B296_00057772 [Ensete ventricosum]
MRDAGGYCPSPASSEAQDSCPKRRWHVIYAHIFLLALSRTSPYVFFISDDCPFRDPRCLLYVQREAGVLRLLLGPSVLRLFDAFVSVLAGAFTKPATVGHFAYLFSFLLSFMTEYIDGVGF